MKGVGEGVHKEKRSKKTNPGVGEEETGHVVEFVADAPVYYSILGRG